MILGVLMVKHPRYQAQDDGRQEEIPRAFERHCGKDFELKRIKPKVPDDPLPGPILRPTFQILDKSGNLVAHFHGGGGSKCHDDGFKVIYEKMKSDIERAGLEAMAEYYQI